MTASHIADQNGNEEAEVKLRFHAESRFIGQNKTNTATIYSRSVCVCGCVWPCSSRKSFFPSVTFLLCSLAVLVVAWFVLPLVLSHQLKQQHLQHAVASTSQIAHHLLIQVDVQPAKNLPVKRLPVV